MESSAKRPLLFLSPTCSSAGRNWADYLMSPMDTCGEKDKSSVGGCFADSFTTPRRKLSLDVDENAQSPLRFEDAGYGGSQGSSSLEASLTRGSGLAPLELAGEGVKPSERSQMKPFSVINADTGARRRTLQARRLKKHVSSSGLAEHYKRNCGTDGHAPIRIPRASSLSFRASSLPSSPLPLDGTPGSQPNSLRQINSPLERMSLMSPINAHPPLHPSRIHRSSSTSSSVAESDGYFSEVFDGEEMEEGGGDTAGSSQPVPKAISSLFSAPITNFVSKHDSSRPGLACPTPVRPSDCLTSSLPASITGARKGAALPRRESLKRSSPSSEFTIQRKAKRPPLPVFNSGSNPSPSKSALKGTPLLRSQSYSVTHTEKAMFPGSPGTDDRELTGDFTRPYILPLVKGTVADLKCISSETLASLLQGDHSNEVASYTIIDCRYPYEFDGGHITGALNIWDKDSLLERFFDSAPVRPCEEEGKRSVLIYHCEFSSKRGPDMSRFMRKIDRERNGINFPSLYYPELYLLVGGYKAFFEKYPELCEPKSYRTMADENHTADLKHFKQRSKSWNGESNSRMRKPLLRHRRASALASKGNSQSTT